MATIETHIAPASWRDLADATSNEARAILGALDLWAKDDGARPEFVERALIAEVRALRYEIRAASDPDHARADSTVDGWYEIELYGHRQRHGHVTETEVAGRRFLEVRTWTAAQRAAMGECADCGHRHYTGDPCATLLDPDLATSESSRAKCGCPAFRPDPAAADQGADPGHVEWYAPSAVFCMTPSTEEAARKDAGIPF